MKFKGLYFFLTWLLRIYFRIFYFSKSEGIENVPKEGSVLICPNHKSFYDGLLVAAFCPRAIRFMAKKEIFKFSVLSWLLDGIGVVPVERSDVGLDTIKLFLKLLKEDNAVSLFPEGTRYAKSYEDVKSGAVMFAIKSETPIIPTAIAGKYGLFKRTKIVFGEPIYYTEHYGKRVSHDELHKLSVELIKKIYTMAGEEK